jgi:hypothetical protein
MENYSNNCYDHLIVYIGGIIKMGKHPRMAKVPRLPESTCEEFAEILEGTILVSTNDLCQVSRTRMSGGRF